MVVGEHKHAVLWGRHNPRLDFVDEYLESGMDRELAGARGAANSNPSIRRNAIGRVMVSRGSSVHSIVASRP